MKNTVVVLLMLMVTGVTVAQEEHVVMHLDFANVEGKNVTDPVSGVQARLMNQATVEEMGEWHVLNLGNGTGYLDLTSATGDIVKGLTDYSVSVYYRIDPTLNISGNGYFLWCFSASAANTATASAYSGYRVNEQRMATSTGGYQNEVGIQTGTPSPKGAWIHMLYRQQNNKGELYINGSLVGTSSKMPKYSTAFTTAPEYNWIGRPPFSGDAYLTNTLVTDFRIYDISVSDEMLHSLAGVTEDLDYDYNYGTPGDPTALQQKVTEVENAMTQLSGNYPQGAIDNVNAALIMARNAIATGSASQALLNSTLTSLQTAYSNLLAKKDFVMWTGNDYDASEDRGFIHPGGLHTQADFDRIKQQLANGNEKVTAAYNVLKNAEFAQPSILTYPTEVIERSSNGGNYMNAARGAAMAYQNALRWKIEDNQACAKAAVRILMQWARVTKRIGGDSNYALASGIYGYQFAQAAELMRDYDGWSREDFKEYQDWMRTVWYPVAIEFLRRRNGTWENAAQWWQAPGTYWSNWGLTNALCVISVGILCDDVFMYNQGMSFIKYDQCGTFKNPRTDVPILNDGLTEFLGNFVVTTYTSELETGAYGLMGQLNESGRDAGHSAMSLGVALDVAKVAWNQGDDLFAYMNHRMAAGTEYLAAQSLSIENLPWVNYHYCDNRFHYIDNRSWLMTGPAMGAQMRPYWGTVIGIYEGVKGVKMPFAEQAYENMGIDGGGQGSTSGGYDHLGYSVLMNTYDTQLCPADKTPTELTPKMEYSGTVSTNLIPSLSMERTHGNVSGQTINHSELGGLVNTYTTNIKTCVPKGETITLMPQLPNGETDSGQWEWNTGETTRNIIVQTNNSHIYRATYTNANGVKSQQAFSIAVTGDCLPTEMDASITYNGENIADTSVTVMYGESVQLHINSHGGYGDYRWDTGETGTGTITVSNLVEDRVVTGQHMSQGGNVQERRFHINVIKMRSEVSVDNAVLTDTTSVVVEKGSDVVFTLNVPSLLQGTATWEDGTEGYSYTMADIAESQEHTLTCSVAGEVQQHTFSVTVLENGRELTGNYVIRHRGTGLLLTSGTTLDFEQQQLENERPVAAQQWTIETSGGKYAIKSQDGKYVSSGGTLVARTIRHSITFLASTTETALYNSSGKKWQTDEDGALTFVDETSSMDFPYDIIPVDEYTGINTIKNTIELKSRQDIYDFSGRKVRKAERGLYIIGGKKVYVQ